MREIKFRAWNKAGEKMLRWDTIKYMLDNPHFDLMQYTGLKDKNGKEIFEGDIVKHFWITKEWGKPDKPEYEIDKIHWSENQYQWYVGLIPLSLIRGELEIIGNIYENPELLEGGNNARKSKGNN